MRHFLLRVVLPFMRLYYSGVELYRSRFPKKNFDSSFTGKTVEVEDCFVENPGEDGFGNSVMPI